MILGVFAAAVVSYLAYRVYRLYYLYTEYLRYKKQGVPFNDREGFSFFRDAKALTYGLNKIPTDFPWAKVLMEAFNLNPLPPVTGLIFLGGHIALSINTVDFLEDIYVNQNKYHTKNFLGRSLFSIFVPGSLNFQETDHPDYKEKRKTLSSALFKQKLLGMTPTMKKVTLKLLKEWQDEGLKEVDLVQATIDLYS